MPSKTLQDLNLISAIRKKYEALIFQGVETAKEVGIEIPNTFYIAIMCNESRGDKYATKTEIGYRDAILRNPKCPSPDKLLNAYCSHSLFQIMGIHSSDYAFLDKLYTPSGKLLIKCGTLSFAINEIYDKPVLAFTKFIIDNCRTYLDKKDYEIVGRIYNGGFPEANFPITQQYVKNLAYYMNLARQSYKDNPAIQ